MLISYFLDLVGQGLSDQVTWEDSLRGKFSKESTVPLRFEKTRLYVSTLAAQLYCEQKVDLEERFGKEDKEVQKVGTEIHNTLVPTEIIETEDLIDEIKKKKVYTTIFPTRYEHDGVIISGIHDGLIFKNGKPVYLIEIKTTRNPKNLQRVHAGERFQAFLYFLSLEQMGFDVSNLKILIPKVLQDVRRHSFIPSLIRYLNDNKEDFENQFEGKIRIHKYSLTEKRRRDTLSKIEDLVQYWREQRPPTGADTYFKCKYCDFNTSCQKSLFRPLQ